jgi:predicted peptidase
MKNFLNLLLAAGALALASCSTMKAQTAAPPPGAHAIENLTAQKISVTMRADYLQFLPKGYDANEGKRWPLILFLHGAGERGTDVWKTAVHGPTKYIEKHPEFPFILVSPICPSGSKWSDDLLLGILDAITAKYAVDTNRIYVTGLSMGGFGTWSLATTYPERFAAVAPICGGDAFIGAGLSMMDGRKAAALKKLPVWAFHGGKDPVVPWAESDRMVQLLKKFGNEDATLTIYPEAGHDSWTVTYDNPELYQWFLQHELQPATRAALPPKP